eukprot:Gb_24923 [translate_table: standard]
MAMARSIKTEMVLAVEGKRMFTAMAKDYHNMLPKAAPDIISSVSILQGDGGAGSITHTDIINNAKGVSYVKARVDEVDEEKMVYKYSMLEAFFEGKEFTTGKYEFKFSPHPQGGCVATLNFETEPGAYESGTNKAHEAMPDFLKKVEQYLLSNPTACA